MIICIFVIIIFSFLYFFARMNKIKNIYLNSFLKYLSLALLISSVIEITVFNYRHYESLLFSNKDKHLSNYIISDGISCDNGLCKIVDKENAYIEYKNINLPIKNIYLDYNGNSRLVIHYQIYFTDAANMDYLEGGMPRDYVKYIDRSHYVRVHASENSEKLKIVFESSTSDFTIGDIVINKTVPIFVNYYRLILLALIIFIIIFINPKSVFYDIKYNSKFSKIFTVIVIIALGLFFTKLATYNKRVNNFANNPYSNHSQYHNLAKALYHLDFSLDLPVNQELLELENPYDPSARTANNVDYFWDYAFYHGKYYSYFGVVPCLMTYLPYYAITHHNLPNSIAIGLFVSFYIFAVFYLIYQIINQYYKKTSFIYYILFSALFVFASGIINCVSCPSFYSIPIIAGIAFACFGIGFWIKATFYKKLNKMYLFLGSLCMALVAGCRPQLLLSAFFSIIIFFDYVFKKRELFSKKSIKETICFLLPIILVALAIMFYNMKRFGSPFDFGANYNLTSNDMTHRGWELDRVFLGLYYFLFSPVYIYPVFPFVQTVSISTTYVGKTISEVMYGGFLFTNFIAYLGLFSFRFKEYIKDKKLYILSIVSTVFAIIIILADTQMSGILPRYILDFGWLLLISTIIVCLSLINSNKVHNKIKKIIIIFILVSIAYNSLLYFSGHLLFASNKVLYYKLYDLFMFWL